MRSIHHLIDRSGFAIAKDTSIGFSFAAPEMEADFITCGVYNPDKKGDFYFLHAFNQRECNAATRAVRVQMGFVDARPF